MRRSFHWFWLLVGWLSLALGAIGALVPLLPTTPFVLLAAFCFSKGSERWHQWLLSQPYFGPMIVDWEAYGVIRPRAKILATILLVPSFGATLLFVPVLLLIKILVAAIGITVLAFIWTRPSQRP